jgi:hypothetical protein
MTTITSLRKQLEEIRKKVAVSEEPMSHWCQTHGKDVTETLSEAAEEEISFL